jgi:hypothetical protein
LRNTPRDTIRRVADLCGLEHERLRLWTFARLAAEASRATSMEFQVLARMLG